VGHFGGHGSDWLQIGFNAIAGSTILPETNPASIIINYETAAIPISKTGEIPSMEPGSTPFRMPFPSDLREKYYVSIHAYEADSPYVWRGKERNVSKISESLTPSRRRKIRRPFTSIEYEMGEFYAKDMISSMIPVNSSELGIYSWGMGIAIEEQIVLVPYWRRSDNINPENPSEICDIDGNINPRCKILILPAFTRKP